ncbi:MAG: type II toxin-antitoxin system MqsA family antitoxin [Thermoflexales bacterium]|nr:type II toxin-antitoxin system MqsA family antitoxin [Thermoflexales bacterium]
MECIYCTGTLVRKPVSYTVSRRGYHLIVDAVPAWVCDQCEEALFDEEAVRAIQDMLAEIDRRVESLSPSPVLA